MNGASSIHTNIFRLTLRRNVLVDEQKRRARVETREVEKMSRKRSIRVEATGPYRRGGQGFECILHGMNPERILVVAEAVGPRRWAQGSRLCRQGVCRVGSSELAKHLSRQSRVQGVRDRLLRRSITSSATCGRF